MAGFQVQTCPPLRDSKALVCLCLFDDDLIYHFGAPTIGPVRRKSALVWSYCIICTPGRGELYITSTVVRKGVAIGGAAAMGGRS
jgi:hypothetical protein